MGATRRPSGAGGRCGAVPALLILVAGLPGAALAGTELPESSADPVTPEILEPREPPPPERGVPDPAWDEIVDRPLPRAQGPREPMALEVVSLQDRQLRVAYPLGLGVGLALALPAIELGPVMLGVAACASLAVSTFAVHRIGREAVDEPVPLGWTLAGTAGGVVAAVATVAFSSLLAEIPMPFALSLLVGAVGLYAATALPTVGAVLGFEHGLRRARARQAPQPEDEASSAP